jgi:hypothetical protein
MELFERARSQLKYVDPPPEDRLSDAERARIGNSAGHLPARVNIGGRIAAVSSRGFRRTPRHPAVPGVTGPVHPGRATPCSALAEFIARPTASRSSGATGPTRCSRRIRKLAGYEAAVTILVTAEMIGFVYYRALARATASPCLGRNLPRDVRG